MLKRQNAKREVLPSQKISGRGSIANIDSSMSLERHQLSH